MQRAQCVITKVGSLARERLCQFGNQLAEVPESDLGPPGGFVNAGALPYGYNGKHEDRLNISGFAKAVADCIPAGVAEVFASWVVAIEHPIVRDGESDWGHLNSGINFGKMLAWAEVITMADEIYTPMPHIWKQNMRLTKDKGLSVQRAETIFPEFTGFRGPRGGLRDGIAEAALIAEWGRRKFLHIQTDEEGLVRQSSRTEPEPLAGVVREVIKPAELQAFKDRRGW